MKAGACCAVLLGVVIHFWDRLYLPSADDRERTSQAFLSADMYLQQVGPLLRTNASHQGFLAVGRTTWNIYWTVIMVLEF